MDEITRYGTIVAKPGTAPAPASSAHGVAFDGLVAVLSTWLMVGLFVDGYFHLTEPDLETFFTPWHALLYSGFLACAVAIIGAAARRSGRGTPLAILRGVPPGYELALLALPFFLVAGFGDMTWHLVFGIEESVDALLSPTHLLLVVSGACIITGPFRAAWRRAGEMNRWSQSWPLLLSLTLVLSAFNFFTQYAHPFATVWAAASRAPRVLFPAAPERAAGLLNTIGIASIVLQTAILVAALLLVTRRWSRLPPGSCTVVIGGSLAVLVLLRGSRLATGTLPLIAVAFAAGACADVLRWRLRPSPLRIGAFRAFAVLVPMVLYALYFVAVALTASGIWWTVHFWTGSIAIAGLVGYLVSLVMVPPPAPETTERRACDLTITER